jgi:predicted ATPase/DNA-binding NarL/FixJ family response regulator
MQPAPVTKMTIPATLTPLIGRQRLLAAVKQQLAEPQVRLLTLTGTGGIGKTRVALQVLDDAAVLFPDGRHCVSLAPINNPDLVLDTIAHVLGVYQPGARPLLERLAEFFSGRHLLVLDNFEQVARAAPQVAELLAACPTLKVLVTSRARLHLSVEHEFPVPPLALPAIHEALDAAALAHYSAVALFVQRAQAVKPDFALHAGNAFAIAEICRRLDGLPLSLELAAARIKLLPPQAMLARLEYRLQLLTGGPLDLPARQHSLRDTLDWSFNLLDQGEQRLFRRLGVFAGGCSIEAIEATVVLAGEFHFSVLDQAGALLDKNLVYQVEQADGTPRLAMLETTREYALEQLRSAGDESPVRRNHALYYLSLAEAAAPNLSAAQQQQWLDRLELEHNNIRAVLGWAVQGPADDLEVGLRTGAALWKFWAHRGHLQEGRQWLARLLATAAGAGLQESQFYAAALTSAGLLAIRQSDFAGAAGLLEAALGQWQALGDAGRWGAAVTLDGLGWAAAAFGDFGRARQLYEASMRLHGELRTTASAEAADVLAHIGMVEFTAGNAGAAEPYLLQSLAAKRALGESWGAAFALYMLGAGAVKLHRHAEAFSLLEEAHQLSVAIGEQILRVFVLETLAWWLAVQPRIRSARDGVQVLSAAAAMRVKLGQPQPPQWAHFFQQLSGGLRERLGEQEFDAARQLGQQLTPDQAFALCRAQAAPPKLESQATPSPFTMREAEVLRLLASGLSDGQIAEELVLSVRTVHAHLQSVYGKLGVNSRTAAVRAAQERSLLS